ncbi:MAG: hypothetical protein IJ350_07690 [Clostridia bacterium]|nr:hypothetical protein [Clostridia bacterium]
MIETIVILVKKALFHMDQAHDLIFRARRNEARTMEEQGLQGAEFLWRHECAAANYATMGYSDMNTAKAIYYAKYEPGTDDILESLFAKCENFVKEILDDQATSHSPQWVDIYMQEILELVEGTEYDVPSLHSES